MKPALAVLALGCIACSPTSGAEHPILVEAEGFTDLGGWVIDPQFMDIMGSPYLLAHGLGRPVADAHTKVTVPAAGNYRVWVRTKDWVAQWKAPGTPGRFPRDHQRPGIGHYLWHRGCAVALAGWRHGDDPERQRPSFFT